MKYEYELHLSTDSKSWPRSWNYLLTNFKIPTLKFFDDERIRFFFQRYEICRVKYRTRLFLIQFAIMEIKHLWVLPRQDAFSCEYLNSGFKRRIVSLIDQKLIILLVRACQLRQRWLKSNYREYLCTIEEIFVERSCARRVTSKVILDYLKTR